MALQTSGPAASVSVHDGAGTLPALLLRLLLQTPEHDRADPMLSTASDNGRAGRPLALLLGAFQVERVFLVGVLLRDARVQRVGVALRWQLTGTNVGLVDTLLVLLRGEVGHPEGSPTHGEDQANKDHGEADAEKGLRVPSQGSGGIDLVQRQVLKRWQFSVDSQWSRQSSGNRCRDRNRGRRCLARRRHECPCCTCEQQHCSGSHRNNWQQHWPRRAESAASSARRHCKR
mmetsp:Transcript_71004/g.159006  ORF Transcript_71004/g.159006 Transcript_71004/m.159006 type:complete len:231 (+) Transcript_71004:104-796(+)